MALFRRFLRENLRGLIGFGIGMLALCFVYLPLYPSFGTEELENIYAQIPESLQRAFGVGGLQDGIGYTHSSIFGLAGTLLLIIALLSWGVRAVAGDEESGALELTLAHGVTRLQLVLQRGAAIVVQACVLGAVVAVGVISLSGPSQLGLDPANVIAASVALTLLGVFFGLLGLAVGAVTGLRAAALSAGASVAVASYVANALGGRTRALEWVRRASPFDWAYGADPLRNGLAAGGLAALVVASVVVWAVAAWGFSRRDLRSG